MYSCAFFENPTFDQNPVASSAGQMLTPTPMSAASMSISSTSLDPAPLTISSDPSVPKPIASNDSGDGWFTFHRFIAWAATGIGQPQTVARDYLGHASYATTADHYTGSSRDAMAVAADAIDRAVGGR